MCSSPRRLGALLLALAASWTIACGHKERPKPPPQRIPDRVQDLRVSQRGDQLKLTFSYPQTTISGLPIDDIVAIELWEMEMPVPDFVIDGEPKDDEDDPEEGEQQATEEGEGTTDDAGDEEAESENEPEEVAEWELAPDEIVTETGDPETPPSQESEGEDRDEVEPEDDEDDDDDRDQDREPTTSKEALLEVDPRQFEASASKRMVLEGTELSNAIRGDKLEIEITLDAIEPGEKEALIFGVKSFQTLKRASAFSNLVRIIPRETPPPPSAIELTPERNGVRVAWTFEGDEPEEFRIYRRDPRGGDFAEHHGTQAGDDDRYFDSRAELGSSYVYAMTAVVNRSPLVESGLSEAHEIEYIDDFPPDPPTDLVVLSEVGAARLLWEASDADDLVGYIVHRRAEGGDYRALVETPIRRLEYVDSAAESGRIYSYRVVAVDRRGNQSDPSEEVQVRIP